jgi:electron transfer flavoprotein alpha/beta subunit
MEGSPTKVVRVFTPPKREGKVEMLTADSTQELAALLTDKILAEKVI